MTKLIVIIIMIVCGIQNLVIGRIETTSEDGVDLFNNMMRDLFESCGTDLGTIGYWTNGENFQLPNEISDVVLFKGSKLTNEILAHRKIRFFVMIFDNNTEFSMHIFEKNPALKIKTMFVFDKDLSWSIFDLFPLYQKAFENCKVYHCSMSKTEENTIDMMTLNTFADYAPPLWSKIYDGFSNYHDHWRFFLGHYSKKNGFNLNGSNICDNIMFDRTRHLDGYAIKVSRASLSASDAVGRVHELITKDTNYRYVIKKLGLPMGSVGRWLISTLNVSLRITYVFPRIDGKHSAYLINDTKLYNNEADLMLAASTFILADKPPHTFNMFYLSYPLKIFHDVIVTHNRGLMTPLEKMFNFYGWLTIIATTIIMLMVFVVTYLSNKTQNSSRLSFSIFECLRLLINNSIYTRTDTAKMRIFFSVIFLYFLILQATFSGHLAAFLTKPEYRKNVETLDDLEDPRYTVIYANNLCKDYITNPLLLNKTIFSEMNCPIEKNESIACIVIDPQLRRLIIKYKLHVPQNVVTYHLTSLTMRTNWPLSDRVNNLIMRSHQSFIYEKELERLDEMEYRSFGLTKDKFINEQSTHNYYRPIEFEDVTFAFIFLTIGLIVSLVSFGLESLYEIIKNTYKKIWRAIAIYIRIEIFQFRQLVEYLYDNFI